MDCSSFDFITGILCLEHEAASPDSDGDQEKETVSRECSSPALEPFGVEREAKSHGSYNLCNPIGQIVKGTSADVKFGEVHILFKMSAEAQDNDYILCSL